MGGSFTFSGYGTHVSLASIAAVFFSAVFPLGGMNVENGQQLGTQKASAESTEIEKKNNLFK